ncbi:MAG: hypothetical protein JSW71_09875 [Gemmatimonadota bacterium]|nr:MAG: hypothetical protein JSW71_09875 [Gemmatimonadota bacterium]
MIQPLIRFCLLSSLAHAAAAPVFGQTGSRLWRPEERALIADMSVVDAVAADENVLYVVTRAGIAVYDLRFDRWELPVTTLDGYVPAPVLAALVDPTDQSLWLGTVTGVANYSPRMRWHQTAAVTGGAAELMMDREDAFAGVYLRNRSGWQFLPRGGVMARPVSSLPPARRQIRTASLQEIVTRHPEIETMRAGTLLDDRMRSFRYTAAAEVPLRGLVFLGTNGLGVVRYDIGIASFEVLPFGLLAPGASAVALAPGGVWVGSDGRSSRSGFTFVSSDLQRFRFEQGPRVTGFGMGAVHAMALRGEELWAATDGGVVVVGPSGAARRFTTVQGLPAGRVLSLAHGAGGVWSGTQRGLALVRDDGTVTRVGAQLFDRVNAVAVEGDRVWVGSRAGLGLSWVGSDRVVVPPDVAAIPELGDAIVDVALSDVVLVAALRDRIVWRWRRGDGAAAAGNGWQVERPVAELGELTSVVCDGDRIWLGGSRGFASYRPATRAFVFYTAPGDVPGVVWDVVVDDRYLWLATEAGLVRVDKRVVP